MELRFDLKEQVDPVTRLGIHGLHRLLQAAEKKPDLYPGIRQSDTLSWTMDSDTIQISFASPSDLRFLMLEAYSSMPNGAVILPGYESNPSSKGFYITALTHFAVTDLFKGGPKGARRTGSFAGAGKDDAYEGLDPARTALMDKKVPLGDFKAKRAFTPNYPYPGVFEALADKIIKDWPKSLDSNLDVSAIFHPRYTFWNNEYIGVRPDIAFVTYFTPLAYIYSICDDGPFGVGMDANRFSEADLLHSKHLGNTKDDQGTVVLGGTVTRIHAKINVAVRALLASIEECPENKTYSVVSPSGALEFFYGGSDTGLYGVFNEILKTILNSEDESDEAGEIREGFRVLRKVPLIQRGDDTILSVYDQVDSNIKTGGRCWYLGLGKAVSVVRKNNRGLFFKEKQVMELLMDKMSTETERTIMEYGHLLKNALAAAYQEEDRNDTYQLAEENFMRIYMAHATHKMSIMTALGKIHNRVVKCSRNWKPDVNMLHVVQEQLNINPRAVKDLLMLGATANYKIRKDVEPTGV